MGVKLYSVKEILLELYYGGILKWQRLQNKEK